MFCPTLAGSGLSDRPASARSMAEPPTLVVTLPVFVCELPVTVAVFVKGPVAPLFTLVVILMFEVAPASRPERVQLTVDVPVQVQPASGLTPTKVTWLGS